MIQSRRISWSTLVQVVLVGLGYYLGALAGVHLTTMPDGIALLWPPNAVLLAALLLTPRRQWWMFCLAVVPAEVAADLPAFTLFQALAFAGVNVFECLAAGLLVHRFVPRNIFSSLRSVFFFGLFSAGVAASLSACLGAAIHFYIRGTETSYVMFWRLWWFGDSLGLMVLTPLLVTWVEKGRGGFEDIDVAHATETVLCCLLGLGAAVLCFSLPENMVTFFALTPILLIMFPLWAAVRLGVRVATLSCVLIAMPVIFFTTAGLGPYGFLPSTEAALKVQELLATIVFASLAISGLVREVERKAQTLELTQQALRKLNVELEERVARRTKQLEEANLQLARLANTDALTQATNRRAFLEQAELEVVRHARYARPLSLVMFDLDHFKAVNDTYGHGVGDEVLKLLACTVRDMIRPSDVFGRIGGEEFVLLLPEQDGEAAAAIAERLRVAVADLLLPTEAGDIAFTISLGVQELDLVEMDVATGLRLADEKMYEAKRSGRNRVVF